jgi:MFS family permease
MARVLVHVVVAAGVGASGLAAGGTAAGLLGVQLSGQAALGGLPPGVLVVGSAIGALAMARVAECVGRVRSLSLGFGLGAGGALVAVTAALIQSFGLLLVGSLLLGIANAALFLSRYAAAAASPEDRRGRAVGLTLGCVAAGAVISPLLLGPSDDLADTFGLPRLRGMFVLAAAVFSLASALLARGATGTSPAEPIPRRGMHQLCTRDMLVATGVLALANLLMVGTMAVVPIRLMVHGHALGSIGLVISAHVAGMFAPAPLTGWLADRVRPGVVAAGGISVLIVTSMSSISMPDPETLTAILVGLGLGWNCGIVGGSALLIARMPPALRPYAEAVGEVAMALAAAVGAPLAGLLLGGS